MISFLRNSKAHIFVDSLDPELLITGEEFHHLSRVLRLRETDHVSVASQGSVREYEITSISREELFLTALNSAVEIDEPEVEVYVSLFKVDRLEWGIAKAVEAGATSIVVGSTSRSPLNISAEKKIKLLSRFETIVLTAAKQSRRASLPHVDFVEDLFTSFEENSAEITLAICDPDGHEFSGSTPVRLLIGPEGGFDEGELSSLSSRVHHITMSPYILRAETAMCVAPALILAADSAAGSDLA